MKLDLKNIQFSRNDAIRGLRLPVKLDVNLAEDLGIMVGDGNIGMYKCQRGMNYQIVVSNNAFTDFGYLTTYVKNLKKRLYNIEFKVWIMGKNKSELRLQALSKGLLMFYSQLGLPIGVKKNIRVPKIIMEANLVTKAAFLRGLCDTDGGVTILHRGKKEYTYPRIKIVSYSELLIRDVSALLNDLELKHAISFGYKHIHPKTKKESILNEITVNGFSGINHWCDVIGFSNPKHISKLNSITGPLGFEPKT